METVSVAQSWVELVDKRLSIAINQHWIFLILISKGSVLLINNKWVPHQVTIIDLDQVFIASRFFDRPLPYLSKEIQNISSFYLQARLNESYHGVNGDNKEVI